MITVTKQQEPAPVIIQPVAIVPPVVATTPSDDDTVDDILGLGKHLPKTIYMFLWWGYLFFFLNSFSCWRRWWRRRWRRRRSGRRRWRRWHWSARTWRRWWRRRWTGRSTVSRRWIGRLWRCRRWRLCTVRWWSFRWPLRWWYHNEKAQSKTDANRTTSYSCRCHSGRC